MRLLGVLRLSRISDASTSIEKQREIIQAYAKAHGHEIVDWAEDAGTSGEVHPLERDSLGPWLADDVAHRYDGIVSWKVDRLSRKLAHFAWLLDWAEGHGKVVIAVTDSIDTSSKMGKLIASILSMFAEFELDTIKERIQGTRALLRGTTRFTGGPVPYGYRVEPLDTGGSHLVPDPDTSVIVQDMITAVLSGSSLADIRKGLNERGVLPPVAHAQAQKGKPVTTNATWTTSGLQAILRSKALLGQHQTSNGTVVRGTDGLPFQRAEALVNQDTFDRLQAALDNAAKPKTYRHGTGLLVDVLACGACGHNTHHQVQRTKHGQYTYYRCGKLCGTSARGERVDQAVTEAVMRALGRQQRLVRRWVPGSDNSEALSIVDRAIEGLREEADLGLYDDDRPAYLKRLQGLTIRRKELAALPTRAGGWEYVPAEQTYGQAWTSMDTAERRELLLNSGIVARLGDNKRVVVEVPADLVQRLAGQGAAFKGVMVDVSDVSAEVRWLGVRRVKA